MECGIITRTLCLNVHSASGEYVYFCFAPSVGRNVHACLFAKADIDIDRGLKVIRRRPGSDGALAFKAPPLIRSGVVSEFDLAGVLHLLQLDRSQVVDATWADNGPGWIAGMLDSAESLLAVEPLRNFPRRIDVGLVGPQPEGHESAFELRALFSDHNGNIVEDPVTGSLNASVAHWLHKKGSVKNNYRASQGTRIGRSGRIDIDYVDGDIWVGGQTRTMFSGKVEKLDA